MFSLFTNFLKIFTPSYIERRVKFSLRNALLMNSKIRSYKDLLYLMIPRNCRSSNFDFLTLIQHICMAQLGAAVRRNTQPDYN